MEFLLNIVWVLMAFGGFAALLSRSRRTGHPSARIRFGQLVAVCLIILSLFPAVSATDDVLRYQFLFGAGASGVHDSKLGSSPNSDGLVLSLVRLFDSLENSTVAQAAGLSPQLLCGALVGLPAVHSHASALLHQFGRSPPLSA